MYFIVFIMWLYLVMFDNICMIILGKSLSCMIMLGKKSCMLVDKSKICFEYFLRQSKNGIQTIFSIKHI